MKLSKNTLAILKNFATINGGIQFAEGNEIRVASIGRSLMGIAKVEETFPVDFALYDLNQFLSVLTLFADPDLEFLDDHLVMSEGTIRLKYYYTDSKNVIAAKYDMALDGGDESLFVSAEELGKLMKASLTLKLADFAIVKEGDSIQMIVEDGDQTDNNEFTIDLTFEVDIEDFDLQLKMDTIKFMKLDYELSFADDNQFLIFENEDYNLTYYVVVQA